jgi:hypothetical protein
VRAGNWGTGIPDTGGGIPSPESTTKSAACRLCILLILVVIGQRLTTAAPTLFVLLTPLGDREIFNLSSGELSLGTGLKL